MAYLLAPSFNSLHPSVIALLEIPVARDTALTPPYPASRASAADQSRRIRSSPKEDSKENLYLHS